MKARFKLPSAALALGLAAVMAVAAPAAAEWWETDDVVGDGVGDGDESYGDLVHVKVNHSLRRVFVRVRYHKTRGDVLVAYLDTRARNAGPEFSVMVGEWPQDRSLYRVDDFGRVHAGGRSANPRECQGLRAQLFDDNEAMLISVPRRCLKVAGHPPARLRASVVAADTLSSGDWVPGHREFSPWLRHAS